MPSWVFGAFSNVLGLFPCLQYSLRFSWEKQANMNRDRRWRPKEKHRAPCRLKAAIVKCLAHNARCVKHWGTLWGIQVALRHGRYSSWFTAGLTSGGVDERSPLQWCTTECGCCVRCRVRREGSIERGDISAETISPLSRRFYTEEKFQSSLCFSATFCTSVRIVTAHLKCFHDAVCTPMW